MAAISRLLVMSLLTLEDAAHRMVPVYGAANVEYMLIEIEKERNIASFTEQKILSAYFWCPDFLLNLVPDAGNQRCMWLGMPASN